MVNAVIITTSVFISATRTEDWGGWVKEDSIISVFKWYYRHLREKISDAPLEIQKTFQKFVENKFSEQGLSYKDEFPYVSITSEPSQVPTATAETPVQESASDQCPVAYSTLLSGMLIIRGDPFELLGRG